MAKGSLSFELQSKNINGEPKIVRALFAPSKRTDTKDVIESLHSELLLIDTEDDLESCIIHLICMNIL